MNELMNKHAVTLLVCSQTSTVALALRAESRVFYSLTRLAHSPVTKGNKKEIAVERLIFTGMGKMFEISVNKSTCPADIQIASRTVIIPSYSLFRISVK